MEELTKEDLGYIFEVALLQLDGVGLINMMNYSIKPKHIILGKEVLEHIKQKWNQK